MNYYGSLDPLKCQGLATTTATIANTTADPSQCAPSTSLTCTVYDQGILPCTRYICDHQCGDMADSSCNCDNADYLHYSLSTISCSASYTQHWITSYSTLNNKSYSLAGSADCSSYGCQIAKDHVCYYFPNQPDKLIEQPQLDVATLIVYTLLLFAIGICSVAISYAMRRPGTQSVVVSNA